MQTLGVPRSSVPLEQLSEPMKPGVCAWGGCPEETTQLTFAPAQAHVPGPSASQAAQCKKAPPFFPDPAPRQVALFLLFSLHSGAFQPRF